MSEELLMRLKSYDDYEDHVEDHLQMLDTLRGIAASHAAGDTALVAGRAIDWGEFRNHLFPILTAFSIVGVITFWLHHKLPYKKMLVFTGILVGVVWNYAMSSTFTPHAMAIASSSGTNSGD